jgi:hypothetical protein
LFFLEEACGFMLALEVRLDFSCCLCGHAVGVTLRCEGQGLTGNPLAAVKVPCPTCNGINQVFFTPEDGRLHRVLRERLYGQIPEPSWN